jgi:hypothetical protein
MSRVFASETVDQFTESYQMLKGVRVLFQHLLASAILVVGCNSPDGRGTANETPTLPKSETAPVTPIAHETPPPLTPPDLQFLGARFERADPSTPGYYWLKATLKNSGPGTAEFEGACKWKCPAGLTVSGGARLAGSLQEGMTLQFNPTHFGGMCAGPPALVDVSCELDVRRMGNSGPGSHQQHRRVKWSKRVEVQF